MILRGTPATIRASWFVDGDITDPGDVTIDITREDGTVLEENAETDGTGAEARTFNLTAATHTNLIDNLTAVWTSQGLGEITTRYEIRADLLFTLDELRSFDNSKFSDINDYSNEVLWDARTRIWQQLEDVCEIAFGTAYRRTTLDGDGCDRLSVPNLYVSALRSVETRSRGSQGWTAFDSDDLADIAVESFGRMTRESRGIFPKGVQNARIGYEHGRNPVPLEIRRAAMMIAVSSDIPSDVDPRAVSYFDGFSTIRYVVPGLTRGAFTSLPEVNEILNRYRDRVPRVA